MQKRTFKYCATHKADEQYMQEMCAQGWAATRLVEGFWTFEDCTPNQYCYRVGYLRGINEEEVEALKSRLSARGIEFVSRYSFWAIFRSREPFTLYSPEEEREIVRKMYAPMPAGAVISWLLFALGLFCSTRFSLYLLIPTVLVGLYGGMCTWLGAAYHKLLKTLS